MASCLGMYIEKNLIKYAKVTKEKDSIKVESFGVKFYEKIGDAINQVISETYSYKNQISINLSEEVYNDFRFFNLLNKNDLKKAIETEFASYCTDKGFNRNALETRYALVQDLEDKEKIKAIYISVNKTEINRRIQEFGENPISMIAPLPIAIANVAEIKAKENIAILNIEEKTTLTTVVNGSVYKVDKMDEGMATILQNINLRENSLSKAYEICKNTTIYTMEGKELISEDETSEYLEDIMPTLYTIATQAQRLLSGNLYKIDKLYITGTGSVINNVDLYFQEYLQEMKCEILKPYFVKESVKINIKDYIEVNSAIALALQQLGLGIKDMNFKKEKLADKLPEWAKMEVGGKGKSVGSKKPRQKFSFSLKGSFDNFEKWLLRTAIGFVEIFAVYCVIAGFLGAQIQAKSEETQEVKTDTLTQIAQIETDISKVKAKTTNYTTIVENLNNYDNEVKTSNLEKNQIPNLLINIMSAIPQGVTITSIENTTSSSTGSSTTGHIVINAQSSKIEYLGYFIAAIKKDSILTNVVSTSGVNVDGVVKIVIEGDLP